MKKIIAIAALAAFTTSSFAMADSVTIRTDNEPTGSIIVKERTEPDVIIKKKKTVVIREDNDPDVVIKNRTTFE